MSVQVKICGITRRDDGLAALVAGADALGIVLVPGSPRHVEAARAAKLVAALRAEAPRSFLAVAVLDQLDAAAGREAMTALGFDRVQFHATGDVPALAACLNAFGHAGFVWGAVRVADATSLEGAEDLTCEAIVLDSCVPGVAGGTGRVFDWTLGAPLAARRQVVLAGGLTPETVGEAVRVVRPWMVDVSSGVEESPGRKDPALVRAFIEAARGA